MNRFKREQYAIAYGSNIGDKENAISEALVEIGSLPQVRLLSNSGVFKTSPVGFESENDFLNGVCIVESTLHPELILIYLNRIEKKLGRVRMKGGYTDRIIDLDIVLAKNLEYTSEDLQIPHPRMHQRQFVLEPLVTIAAKWEHPILLKSVKELLNAII